MLTRGSFRGCVDGIGTVGGETPRVSAIISILDMWTVQVQGDLTLPYLPVRSIKGMWIAGQTGAAPAFFSGWIDQPRYPVCVRCCYA